MKHRPGEERRGQQQTGQGAMSVAELGRFRLSLDRRGRVPARPLCNELSVHRPPAVWRSQGSEQKLAF
jgi:hypothetical protein